MDKIGDMDKILSDYAAEKKLNADLQIKLAYNKKEMWEEFFHLLRADSTVVCYLGSLIIIGISFLIYTALTTVDNFEIINLKDRIRVIESKVEHIKAKE